MRGRKWEKGERHTLLGRVTLGEGLGRSQSGGKSHGSSNLGEHGEGSCMVRCCYTIQDRMAVEIRRGGGGMLGDDGRQSKRLRSLYSKSRGSKNCGEGTLEPRGLSRDFWICSLTSGKQGAMAGQPNRLTAS